MGIKERLNNLQVDVRQWRTELPPETPAMQADPAIAVYRVVMARIVALMPTDPDNGTTEGDELNALVDLAQVYERRWITTQQG